MGKKDYRDMESLMEVARHLQEVVAHLVHMAQLQNVFFTCRKMQNLHSLTSKFFMLVLVEF